MFYFIFIIRLQGHKITQNVLVKLNMYFMRTHLILIYFPSVAPDSPRFYLDILIQLKLLQTLELLTRG